MKFKIKAKEEDLKETKEISIEEGTISNRGFIRLDGDIIATFEENGDFKVRESILKDNGLKLSSY